MPIVAFNGLSAFNVTFNAHCGVRQCGLLTPAKATIVAFEVMIGRNSRPDCARESVMV